MQPKFKTEIKFAVGFAMSLVALLVLMVISYQSTKDLVATENWVVHTQEVITELQTLQATLLEVESSQRGYILTGNPQFMNDRQAAARQIPAYLQKLRALVADNPVQIRALNQLEPVIQQRLALLDERVAIFQRFGLEAAADAQAFLKGKAAMDQVLADIDQMRLTEVTLRDHRQQFSNRDAHRTLLIIALGTLVLLLAGGLAMVLFRRDFKLRRRTEEVLKQSEERTRLMLDSIKDYSVIMLDPEGRVVRWNEGARRLKGYEAKEIIGEHFSRFYPEPEARAGMPDKLLAVARAEGRAENEGWRLRKDGSRFWADVAISAVQDQQGGLLGFVKVTRDLTERQRAEQILRASQQMFQRLFESAPDATVQVDNQGHIVRVNPQTEKLFGYAAGELAGQGVEILLPERYRERHGGHLAAYFAAPRARVMGAGLELLGRRKDGSEFPVDIMLSPLQTESDTQALAVVRDITERQQARDELQKSRAQLQAILDNSPALIYVKDLAGRYQFVNRQFEQVFKQTREDIVGKTAFDIAPREIAEAATAHHQKVLETQAAIELEETVFHSDGPHPHLAVKFPLRDANGHIYATSGISTDISLSKRAEQIQRERDRFFELTSDLICTIHLDGLIKTVNPAWETVLGLPPAELVGAPFIDLVHPADRDVTRTETARLAEGLTTRNLENRLRGRDGSYRWFSWSARAALGQKLIYAAARDVTEQKEVQEKILRLNDQLQRHAAQVEAANQELEAFSYSVSHDLRAPVRHIDGFVKMMEKQCAGTLDDRGRRFLGIIGDAAHQMGNLIDDLLVFSRMGRTDLRPTSVASNSLVDEAVSALQVETNGRNIRWQINSLPKVEADLAMLRQVWINLIANAVKYSRPRDPAEIEIGSTRSEEGESIFYVRDNGVGFDMKYVDKLFGVFQRLHRAEEFEGTGIGLANVRRIVSRHGGRTWAESKLNEGSTFYFSLPDKINLKSNHQ